MKASELAIRIIEAISLKGDFQVHPSTKLSTLFHGDRPNIDYLDLSQVQELSHYSRSSIYRMMDLGEFPLPVKMGERKVRWRAVDINKWLNSRNKIA